MQPESAVRVILAAVPKCGTNLITQMFGHGMVQHIPVSATLVFGSHQDPFAPRPWREKLIEDFEEAKEAIKESRGVSFGHIPYDVRFADALDAMPTKIIFLIRDPRDRIISQYFWMKKRREAQMNVMLSNGKTIMEQDDPISTLIDLEADLWRRFWGWRSDPRAMTVTFEDLIEQPIEAARAMCSHIGNEADVLIGTDINGMMFRIRPSRSPTFREGKVGGWKEHMTERHQEQLKDLDTVIGELGYDISG